MLPLSFCSKAMSCLYSSLVKVADFDFGMRIWCICLDIVCYRFLWFQKFSMKLVTYRKAFDIEKILNSMALTITVIALQILL